MATIHSLRIFLEVYRTHSVTEASRNLFITQPAVTRAIQDLEREYSIRLFERYHRRLIPTAVAERLYTHSTQIVDSMDSMEDMLQQEHYQSKIRIGSSITIGTLLMPKICSRFKKLYPGTRLEVTISNGSLLQSSLLDNSLDIALIEDSIHETDLKGIPFYHDDMVLIMPKDHPLASRKNITLSEISSYPMLLREKGSAGREYVDDLFARENIVISPLWQSVSTQALINGVEAGLGISILPRFLCESAIKKKEIVIHPISHQSMKRTYYIVTHKEKYITEELKALQNVCKDLPQL